MICTDPSAGVSWAGDWGKWWGAACMYTPGLPEPLVVDATVFGSDCTIAMAEVWIPGITDVDGNQALIRTRALIEDPTGVEDDFTRTLTFQGRFGNNYRYGMNFQGGGWFMQPFGTYDMRLQFSHIDENIGCWYTIGLGDGPDGGAPRTVEWVP